MSDELAPMNVAELMDRAIWAYKKSFWKQIAYAAILGVIFVVVVFVVGIIAVITAVMHMIAGVGYMIGFAGFFGIVILVGLPLYLLWMGFSSAGHILLTRRALFGHIVNLPRVKIHVMAFRAISALLAQAVVFAPLIFLLFLVFRAVALPFLNVVIGELSLLFLLLFVAATLLVSLAFMVVATFFSLSIAAAMFEGRLFFKSLSRSWELMRGDFWKILGTRVLWYLVAMGFAMAGQGIITLLWMLIGVILGTGPVALYVVVLPVGFISSIVSFMVSFAQIPMDGIMQACIYYNQRIKKDGLDLELRLTKLWQTRESE